MLINGTLKWQEVSGADAYLVYIHSGEQTVIAASQETEISPPFPDECEWAEGLRWLSHLRPERGTFLADTRRIVPPFACRDRRLGARNSYPDCGVEAVRGRVGQSIALDALGVAEALGNPRAANTVLLGALSSVLDFPAEEWRGRA